MATVSAEVRFAPQLTAWFTANPTKVLQDGEIVYCSDGANIGKYVIGDNSTQLSSLVFYGGLSSSGLTIGTTTITSGTNTRILYNNAGVVGEYLVTGTGTTAVLSTSPTFTTDITTPLINPSTFLNVGNAAVAGGALSKMRVGLGTGYVDLGERTVGLGAIWFTQSTPTTANFALGGSAAGSTILNGSGTNGTIDVRSLGSNILIMKGASTTGSNISNEWTPLAKTNETATSLASNLFRVSPNGTQYTTGATLAKHADYYFRANTITATSATQTITDLVSGYFEAPVASTNITATNTWSIYSAGRNRLVGYTNIGNAATSGGSSSGLRVGVGSSYVDIGEHSGGNAAIWFMQATPGGGNYSFLGDGTNSILNCQAGGSVFLRSNNTSYLTVTSTRITVNTSTNNTQGTAALATTATDGFLYVNTCAGVPTGVPTAYTGNAAMVYDSTNNKLYVYGGGSWNIMN